MKTIGRNDLCACGSGKKYKKCCGKNEVVSIGQLVENELNDIQSEIFQFSVDMYTDVIDDYLEQYEETFENLPDDIADLFDFFARLWVVSSVKFEGKTILEQYIDVFSKKYNRPRTRDLLQQWKKARPSGYMVTQVDQSYVTVQDIFTKAEQRVKIYETETNLDTGYFLFGTLLPTGANSIFFTTFLELPEAVAESMASTLVDLYQKSGETNSVDFMSKHFINVFSVFMFGSPGVTVDDYDWSTPVHKIVALLFENRMLRHQFDEEIIGMGLTLWAAYCKRQNPVIKKAGIYAAALVNIVEHIYPYDGISTQQELAEEFEVSATSISTRKRDMEFFLKEEINHYTNLVEEADDEFDEFLKDILKDQL